MCRPSEKAPIGIELLELPATVSFALGSVTCSVVAGSIPRRTTSGGVTEPVVAVWADVFPSPAADGKFVTASTADPETPVPLLESLRKTTLPFQPVPAFPSRAPSTSTTG